jgi:hypothetical protein
MTNKEMTEEIDFSVNLKNLYREEAFTDMKGASIRQLKPIKPDGSIDKRRDPIFFGHTQLLFPEGSIPVQCVIDAKKIDQAFKKFPSAMQAAAERLLTELAEMEKENKKEESRIILPGK